MCPRGEALHHQTGNPHTVTQQRQWERYNFSLKMAQTLFIWSESQKYSKLSFSWAAVTPVTLNNRCWRMVFYYKQHSQTPLIFVPSEYPHEVWAVRRNKNVLSTPSSNPPDGFDFARLLLVTLGNVWSECFYLVFPTPLQAPAAPGGEERLFIHPDTSTLLWPILWATPSLLAKASNPFRQPAQPFVSCLS